MWFGACIAPGARMQAPGLVYPLFVAQLTWLGIPDVSSMKGEWVEHGTKGYEIHEGNNTGGA